MRFTSIKFKIALIATLIFIVLVALISAAQIWYLQKSIEELLSAQQFSLVTGAAEDLDAKLNVRTAALTLVANEIPQAAMRDPRALRELLKGQLALKSMFDRVFAFSSAGAIFATLPELPGAQELNVADREYFRETMSTRRSIISAPYLGKLSRQPAVMVTAPVIDSGGNVVAMLGGTFNLLERNFLGEIGTKKIGKTGYFYMIAKGATPLLVSHPDKKRVMTAAPSAEENPSLARALAGFEGTLLGTNSVGLRGLFSFKSLESARWLLAAVLPEAEAFAPIENMKKRTLLITVSMSLLVAPLIWIVVYRLLAPLQLLGAKMRSLHAHGYRNDVADQPTPRNDEIGDLAEEFNALIRERRQVEQQLEHMAQHDALTGLPNRALFLDRLSQAAARSVRSGKPLAVMYLDIDHFKRINDTLGHAAGDALLVAFAAMLQGCVRGSDTVARFGGDEFVVLLEDLHDRPDAEAVAHKIVKTTQATPQATVGITTSLGIAYVEKLNKCDPSDIMKHADAAMYEAKKAGRNRYFIAPDG